MKPIFDGRKGTLKCKKTTTGSFSFASNPNLPVFLFHNVTVRDMVGLDAGGLEQIAKQCGIDVASKNVLNNYKTNMDQAIRDKPKEFVEYSMNDAVLLKQVLQNTVIGFNTILKRKTFIKFLKKHFLLSQIYL